MAGHDAKTAGRARSTYDLRVRTIHSMGNGNRAGKVLPSDTE